MKKKEIISTIELMTEQLSELKRIVFNEEIEEDLEIDYSVNWNKAPDWALAHAYNKNGEGFWYGPHINLDYSFRFGTFQASLFQIEDSLMEIHQKTWQNSIIEKPLMF